MSLRVVVAMISFALLARGGGATADAGEWPFRMVTVEGRVEMQIPGATAWSAGKLRAELQAGSSARTLRGRLTLETPSDQEVRLAGLSKVSLLDGNPDVPTPVRIDAGMVWVAVSPGTPSNNQLEIQGKAASVLVSGGGVSVALGQDGAMLVRVYHGAATATGPGTDRRWSRPLGEGEELLVAAAGVPGPAQKIVPKEAEAEWVKWNEDQDHAGGYGSPTPPK